MVIDAVEAFSLVVCGPCQTVRPLDSFGQYGQHRACRECRRVYRKRWSSKNKDKIRDIVKRSRAKHKTTVVATRRRYDSRLDVRTRKKLSKRRSRLKQRFGITPEQYDSMLLAQAGVCLICGKLPGTKRLAVDHDHTTSEVRGLLCTACNTALGLLGDSVETLHKASQYLMNGQQCNVCVSI